MPIDWESRRPIDFITDLEGFTRQDFIDSITITAKEGEDFAKSNHVWRNITSVAEKGLKASWAQIDESTFEIYIEYDESVQASRGKGIYYYGLSLEYLHDGRFAVLPDTVEFMFERVMKELEQRWQE